MFIGVTACHNFYRQLSSIVLSRLPPYAPLNVSVYFLEFLAL